jgi:cytochrome c553
MALPSPTPFFIDHCSVPSTPITMTPFLDDDNNNDGTNDDSLFAMMIANGSMDSATMAANVLANGATADSSSGLELMTSDVLEALPTISDSNGTLSPTSQQLMDELNPINYMAATLQLSNGNGSIDIGITTSNTNDTVGIVLDVDRAVNIATDMALSTGTDAMWRGQSPVAAAAATETTTTPSQWPLAPDASQIYYDPSVLVTQMTSLHTPTPSPPFSKTKVSATMTTPVTATVVTTPVIASVVSTTPIMASSITPSVTLAPYPTLAPTSVVTTNTAVPDTTASTPHRHQQQQQQQQQQQRRPLQRGTASACSICHGHKTRCDGQRPCGRCIRLSRADKCVDRVKHTTKAAAAAAQHSSTGIVTPMLTPQQVSFQSIQQPQSFAPLDPSYTSPPVLSSTIVPPAAPSSSSSSSSSMLHSWGSPVAMAGVAASTAYGATTVMSAEVLANVATLASAAHSGVPSYPSTTSATTNLNSLPTSPQRSSSLPSLPLDPYAAQQDIAQSPSAIAAASVAAVASAAATAAHHQQSQQQSSLSPSPPPLSPFKCEPLIGVTSSNPFLYPKQPGQHISMEWNAACVTMQQLATIPRVPWQHQSSSSRQLSASPSSTISSSPLRTTTTTTNTSMIATSQTQPRRKRERNDSDTGYDTTPSYGSRRDSLMARGTAVYDLIVDDDDDINEEDDARSLLIWIPGMKPQLEARTFRQALSELTPWLRLRLSSMYPDTSTEVVRYVRQLHLPRCRPFCPSCPHLSTPCVSCASPDAIMNPASSDFSFANWLMSVFFAALCKSVDHLSSHSLCYGDPF